MMDEYYNGAEFREKLRQYEEARKRGVSVFLDCDDLMDIAEYYRLMGRDDDASRLCDEASRFFPDSSLPLLFRARCALVSGNGPDEAERILGLVADTSEPEYHYLKAEIMIARRQEGQANRYLERVYGDIDDDEKPDFVLDVAALMADYSLTGYARQWLSRSDETDLDDYQEIKGRIAMGEGQLKESEAIFSRLLDKNPRSADCWNQLAIAQSMLGKVNDSISSSEYAIAINPSDDEALMNKANGLFSLGNYEEALDFYRRYTRMGDKWLGLSFQAVTLIGMHEDAKARCLLEEAVAGCPDDHPGKPELLRQLCVCLMDMGLTDEALEWAGRMQLLHTIDADEALVFKGYLFLSAGKGRQAHDCFRAAMAHSPQRIETALAVCVAFHDCGHHDEAYRLHRQVLEETGGDAPFGYAYLADTCRRLGRQAEYLSVLKKACETCPDEVGYVFGDEIPAGMPPADYWGYVVGKMKKAGNEKREM